MAAKIVAATETFACEHDGHGHVVHAGERLPADHPLVSGRDWLFEPADTQVDHPPPKPAKRKPARRRKPTT